MEDSVAIKKGLLWCAIKENEVSAVYMNWRVRTLPLPIRIFARIFFVPVLGFICLIDQVEGESSHLLPFHSFNS